jgi:hypothetical protein
MEEIASSIRGPISWSLNNGVQEKNVPYQSVVYAWQYSYIP